MCKESEVVGLQNPEHRRNAFMLQATIRNSAPIYKNNCLEKKTAVCSLKNHGLNQKNTKRNVEVSLIGLKTKVGLMRLMCESSAKKYEKNREP